MNTQRSKRGAFLASFLLLLFASLDIAAQNFPSQDAGTRGNSVYQTADLDSVDLFNGNLTLNVPLGQRYPVGPNLSHGLSLVYNANRAWRTTETGCTTERHGDMIMDIPHPRDAVAGLGWQLRLPVLYSPGGGGDDVKNPERWVYGDGDGTFRSFFPNLHPPMLPEGDVWYTNDGSYIRLQGVPSGCLETPGSACAALVEHPTGEIHEFEFASAGWRLKSIRDPFFNRVNYNYGGAGRLASISDSWRTITLRYVGGQLDEIEVPTFGDGNSGIYQFEYDTQTIERHNYPLDQYTAKCINGTHPGDPETVSATFLTRIVRPDNSFYDITYFAVDDDGTNATSGYIQTLRTPAELYYDWKYREYSFPYQLGPNFHSPRAASRVFGVKEKKRYGKAGNSVVDFGTWTYTPRKASFAAPTDHDPPDPNVNIPCYQWTEVVDPEGRKMVQYFVTANQGFEHQHGLDYRACDPATEQAVATGPFLSSELFAPNGTKLREVWKDYESDGAGSGTDYERTHRLTHHKTIYVNKAGQVKETLYSDFDGLGHARHRQDRADFPTVGTDRHTQTSYNPGSGSPRDFTYPDTSLPWIVNGSWRRAVTEGGTTSVTSTWFYQQTGFIHTLRTYRGIDPGPGDVVVKYDKDSAGFVTEERYYGGDSQNLSALGYNTWQVGSLTEQFRLKHQYASGTRKTTDYLNPDGSLVLRTLDADIDAHTGLASASRDSSGVETDFHFDVLGRISREHPEGSSWTQHQYFFPTQSDPHAFLKYHRRQCEEGFTTCPNGTSEQLTRNEQSFDRAGRLVSGRRLIPVFSGSSLVERKYQYNAMGWLTEETRWGHEEQVTTYSNYDNFGRVKRVTHPNGDVTNLWHNADWRSDTTSQIQTSTGLQPSTTIRFRDSFGRVVRVQEPSGGGGNNVQTTYRYNQDDLLTRVCINDGNTKPDDACNGQQRTFTYDGQGRLLSETHPELGCDGGGTISYTYDAMGNRLSQKLTDGGCTDSRYDLTFRYDRAGRPTQVRDSQNRLLTEAFYETANRSASNKTKGKLVMTKRHNYVPTDIGSSTEKDIVVTEGFHYNGRGGRFSTLWLWSNSPEAPSFKTHYEYDDFGNVTSLEYPECQYAPCEDLQDRTVNFAYSRGMLNSIPGKIPTIRYHASGQLAYLKREGAMETHYEADPADSARLHRIRTVGEVKGNYNSGYYSYDPSGNITAIGADTYAYDLVGRLTEGTTHRGYQFLGNQPTPIQRTQRLTYDAFGNILTNFMSDHSTLTLGVDSATNRMTGYSTTYDIAGNARTSWGYTLDYDPFNRMTYLDGGSNAMQRGYLYTAGGERVAALDYATGEESWTPRGTDNGILSAFTKVQGGWSWDMDYVHGAGTLLAQVVPTSTGTAGQAVLTDHLGSTRMLSWNDGGGRVSGDAYYSYYPFGANTEDPVPEDQKLQFTGHERDDNGGGLTGDLDYMHARYYHPMFGRFLSVDPVLGDPEVPQSWNRFAYVKNNPLSLVDPDGLAPEGVQDNAGAALVYYAFYRNPVAIFEKIIFTGVATLGATGGGVVGDVSTGIFVRWIPGIDSQLQKIARDSTGVNAYFPLPITSMAVNGVLSNADAVILGPSVDSGAGGTSSSFNTAASLGPNASFSPEIHAATQEARRQARIREIKKRLAEIKERLAAFRQQDERERRRR